MFSLALRVYSLYLRISFRINNVLHRSYVIFYILINQISSYHRIEIIFMHGL